MFNPVEALHRTARPMPGLVWVAAGDEPDPEPEPFGPVPQWQRLAAWSPPPPHAAPRSSSPSGSDAPSLLSDAPNPEQPPVPYTSGPFNPVRPRNCMDPRASGFPTSTPVTGSSPSRPSSHPTPPPPARAASSPYPFPTVSAKSSGPSVKVQPPADLQVVDKRIDLTHRAAPSPAPAANAGAQPPHTPPPPGEPPAAAPVPQETVSTLYFPRTPQKALLEDFPSPIKPLEPRALGAMEEDEDLFSISSSSSCSTRYDDGSVLQSIGQLDVPQCETVPGSLPPGVPFSPPRHPLAAEVPARKTADAATLTDLPSTIDGATLTTLPCATLQRTTFVPVHVSPPPPRRPYRQVAVDLREGHTGEELTLTDSLDCTLPTDLNTTVEYPRVGAAAPAPPAERVATREVGCMAGPAEPGPSHQLDKDRLQRSLDRLKQAFPKSSTRQVNCVLFGRQGNGKSSLINSIYQTLTGSSARLCDEGAGDASKTVRYALCDLLCQEGAAPLNLFDTKGLADADDAATNKLLSRILRGKFKPNHSMNNPKWYDAYVVPQVPLKVDAVVYVHAFGAAFAYRLAAAVARQAKAQGITIVPVITCYDLVERPQDLQVEVETCSKVFNTHPFCLANLSALRTKYPAPGLLEAHELFAKGTVVDLVSQLMTFGQQHQRANGYATDKPFVYKTSDCRMM
eukprot:EG_transcript_5013